MADVHLALGSNVGDREGTLVAALQRIARWDKTRISRVSGLWETEPISDIPQPKYINLVVELESEATPEEIIAAAMQTESDLGRVRRERWGPRTIDIDVLRYDDRAIESETLTVPHPRMTERAFVMVPLAEISPDVIIRGATAAHWAGQLGTFGLERIGELEWESGLSA